MSNEMNWKLINLTIFYTQIYMPNITHISLILSGEGPSVFSLWSQSEILIEFSEPINTCSIFIAIIFSKYWLLFLENSP